MELQGYLGFSIEDNIILFILEITIIKSYPVKCLVCKKHSQTKAQWDILDKYFFPINLPHSVIFVGLL